MEDGARVSFGSVFFRDYVADVTPEFRSRIDRAGFIAVGRTNVPEFGLLPTTEPALWGPTRNPWNLEHSAGGSSGGAAAAVAAGIVPLAHGSDGGGSIRIPASTCGVFGLKPSRGRNPRRPAATPDYLSVELALTRSVRDSAALLDAVAGPVPGDQYWAPPPPMSFAEAATTDPEPLTIAFSLEDSRGNPVHPDCAQAVIDTAHLLEDLGHNVEEAALQIDGDQMAEAFVQVWASLASGAFQIILDAAAEYRVVRTLRARIGDWWTMKLIARLDQRRTGISPFEPFTWALADRARHRRPAELDLARRNLQEIAHRTGAFLETYGRVLDARPRSSAAPPRRDRPNEAVGRAHRAAVPLCRLHTAGEFQRNARHVGSAPLERRGAPDRLALPRSLRRRDNALPPRRPAGTGSGLVGSAPRDRPSLGRCRPAPTPQLAIQDQHCLSIVPRPLYVIDDLAE